MASKHRILKYYSDKTIGTKNYRGILPTDIDKALILLQMETGIKNKEKLMFAAARIGLGLPTVNE